MIYLARKSSPYIFLLARICYLRDLKYRNPNPIHASLLTLFTLLQLL